VEIAVKMLREKPTLLLIQAIPFQLICKLVGISFSLIQNLVKLSFAALQILYRPIQTTYSLYSLVKLVQQATSIAELLVYARMTVNPEDLSIAI
jgi:histone H3/H4